MLLALKQSAVEKTINKLFNTIIGSPFSRFYDCIVLKYFFTIFSLKFSHVAKVNGNVSCKFVLMNVVIKWPSTGLLLAMTNQCSSYRLDRKDLHLLTLFPNLCNEPAIRF